MTTVRVKFGHKWGRDTLHVRVPAEVAVLVEPMPRWPCWVCLSEAELLISADLVGGWPRHAVYVNKGATTSLARAEALSRSVILQVPRWLWPRRGWPEVVDVGAEVRGRTIRVPLPEGWSRSCPPPPQPPPPPPKRSVGRPRQEEVRRPRRAKRSPVRVSDTCAMVEPPADRATVKAPVTLYGGPAVESPLSPVPRIYTKTRVEVRVNRPPAMVRGPRPDVVSDARDARVDHPRVVVAVPGDPPPGRSALDDRRRGTTARTP